MIGALKTMKNMEFHFRFLDNENYLIDFTKEIPTFLFSQLAFKYSGRNIKSDEKRLANQTELVIPSEQHKYFLGNVLKNVEAVEKKVKLNDPSRFRKLKLLGRTIQKIVLTKQSEKTYVLQIRIGGYYVLPG